MPAQKIKSDSKKKGISVFQNFFKDTKSFILLVGGLSLLIFSILCFFHTPNRKFESLCNSIFVKELNEDGLSLHFTLSNPKQYGFSQSSPTLPVYSRTQSLADYKLLLATIEELDSINKESLNETNRRTYEILSDYLHAEADAYPYLYYDEPLSPVLGIQNQLPVLLAEYAFRDKSDIDDYLCLLQSIPSYFNGLIQFEEEKASAGLFMSTNACRQTIEQCNAVISSEELAAHTHFLQTSFAERLEVLVNENLISPEEQTAYQKANDEMLLQCVLPAYKAIAHELTSLLGSGRNDNGLCYFPDGKEYYEHLIAQKTGSSKKVNQMMSAIKTSFVADYNAFIEVLSTTGIAENTPVFSIADPEKMLASLEKQIADDFPAYPGAEQNKPPVCQIKAVNPSMEQYLSPAFYFIPPIDNVTENTIYINYAHAPEHLDLYTTLAHEGYPGHLYQSVYSTLSLAEQNAHPIRNLLHFGGYTEGYATYAEFYSYHYATAFGEKDYCDLVCLNRKLHLALYSMLDISIHYYGATYEDAHRTLSSFGIEDKKTTREIYDYIVNSPGNYLQYYVGYLEIMECRELARLKWGENYSDYNFHEFLLSFGPANFETIQDAIRTYKAPKIPSPVLQSCWCPDDWLLMQETPLHQQ